MATGCLCYSYTNCSSRSSLYCKHKMIIYLSIIMMHGLVYLKYTVAFIYNRLLYLCNYSLFGCDCLFLVVSIQIHPF